MEVYKCAFNFSERTSCDNNWLNRLSNYMIYVLLGPKVSDGHLFLIC